MVDSSLIDFLSNPLITNGEMFVSVKRCFFTAPNTPPVLANPQASAVASIVASSISSNPGSILHARSIASSSSKLITMSISLTLNDSAFFAMHGPIKTVRALGCRCFDNLAVNTIGDGVCETFSLSVGMCFSIRLTNDGQQEVVSSSPSFSMNSFASC